MLRFKVLNNSINGNHILNLKIKSKDKQLKNLRKIKRLKNLSKNIISPSIFLAIIPFNNTQLCLKNKIISRIYKNQF